MKPNPWGEPARGPAHLAVEGTDADLAGWVRDHPGALFRFTPSRGSRSGVAAALGLRERGPDGALPQPVGTEVPLDAIRLADGTVVVNMAILGTPPDRLRRYSAKRQIDVVLDGVRVFGGRATTVVLATGQYLRGLDLVPRGHPGDGLVEVQVYRLAPSERRAMRSRLPGGTHVPHPRITQRSGHEVEIRVWGEEWGLEVDGGARPPVSRLDATVVPAAYRLLV